MGSVRARTDNQLLFFDFRYMGRRCREQTTLADTKANRQKMTKILAKIEEEISKGEFEYGRYFPNSKRAASLSNHTSVFDSKPSGEVNHIEPAPSKYVQQQSLQRTAPLFKDFCDTWYNHGEVGWRRSYRKTVRLTLDKHLIPEFGDRVVSDIRREDILDFRSKLAKVPGRKGQTLSARRINAIVLCLRQIMNEAADRYHFTTPGQRVKPLKIRKVDIAPFTLEEVNKILFHVRKDYHDYFVVRFFSGMRTGEIHGLKWRYVDFERRLILIRETIVDGEIEEDAKTELSQRDIQMSEMVHQALKRQKESTPNLSEFVFCNAEGNPLNLNNFTNRVWYPLLRYLGLELRRPYMTRHTTATLWLAAGENPEWIARQLGHSSTEMLFRVYSRYVPNLTRRDGSAFERLLLQSGATDAAANEELPVMGISALNDSGMKGAQHG